MTAHEPGLHDYPIASEPPEPPQPPSAAVRPYRGLAIAGFAVSIVAVIFGLIPILFLLAWAGGALGVTFGILGRRWRLGKAAIALSVVALGLGIAGVVIVNNATTKLNHDLNSLTQPPVATAQTPTPQSTTGSVPEGQPQPKATGVPLTPPTEEPTPAHEYNAKFGAAQTITGDASYGAVNATYTVSAPVLDYSMDDGYTKPTSGQFVSFNVHLAAHSDGMYYSPGEWYVRDANGGHHEASYSGKEPTFPDGTAHTGEQVSGWVTVDGPRHGTLVYSPTFSLAGPLAEWPF